MKMKEIQTKSLFDAPLKCHPEYVPNTGADPGGAPGVRPHPPKIGKKIIFWHKIVIFSYEIPQKCSRLPPLGTIFLSVPPLT
jgi:hypothetical protein